MGLTLDQLLDATGVSELSGGHQKRASAPERMDLLKLAERCRQAADASPEDQVEEGTRELVEKTAAVAIIRRTLAEIDAIGIGGSEKVASPPGPDHSAFIKKALEQGHSPESIARFLQDVEQKKRTAKTSANILG